MYYYGVYIKVNIDPVRMDKINVRAKDIATAAEKAKDIMFRRLSLQGKTILENDIEIIMIKDDMGKRVV